MKIENNDSKIHLFKIVRSIRRKIISDVPDVSFILFHPPSSPLKGNRSPSCMRWMFWSTTQWPSRAALFTEFMATISCPCPIEMLLNMPLPKPPAVGRLQVGMKLSIIKHTGLGSDSGGPKSCLFVSHLNSWHKPLAGLGTSLHSAFCVTFVTPILI